MTSHNRDGSRPLFYDMSEQRQSYQNNYTECGDSTCTADSVSFSDDDEKWGTEWGKGTHAGD